MRLAMLPSLTLIALGLAIAPGTARAANLINNGSFEDPAVTTGQFQTFATGSALGSQPGWKVVGASGKDVALVETTYIGFNAQNGLNSLDLTGSYNAGTTVGVEQLVDTEAGKTYKLSFYVGRMTEAGGPGGNYADPATADLSIDGGSRMSFTNSNITLGGVDWEQFTHTFTAVGAHTTITFYNGTSSSSINYVGLDNVSLEKAPDGTVPEPASMAMLATGALALVAVRAARRRTV